MRKITGAAYLSLDGIMQAPGGPDEDASNGFAHGGWIVPHSDHKTGALVAAYLETPHDLLLGRQTYDIFAGYWPHVSVNNPIGKALNTAAKHVLTHGSQPLDWDNSHRHAGIDAIRTLKATAGPDLFIWGSSTLFPQLFAAHLIDRLMLMTFPVVLGMGKRLFGQGTPPFGMKLINSDVSGTGVLIATYEPAGPVQTGSY
jgi:dihydrofolate reductase